MNRIVRLIEDARHILDVERMIRDSKSHCVREQQGYVQGLTANPIGTFAVFAVERLAVGCVAKRYWPHVVRK